MGDEFKQCFDGSDRCHHRDPLDDCQDCCHDQSQEFSWETWLPVIIVLLLLFGGSSLGGSKDDCGSNGIGTWLLVLVVIWVLFARDNDKGGLFGGLFG